MAESSSIVTENYLKHIYALALDQQTVKTSALAKVLALSPAAVTEMLKRLDEQKLVSYRPYQGVSLTELGRKRALAVVRRHRLWEVFLTRELGLSWDQVHVHAERLEHATDAQLASLLDDYLGNPSVDPHGHPIPTADGDVDEIERLRLTDLRDGDSAQVVLCENEDSELLGYLQRVGLIPQVCFRLIDRAPLNGPLNVEIDGTVRLVGAEAATTLLVRRISAV